MPDLRMPILRTVVYFDLFDFPLTAVEIRRFLYFPGGSPVSYEEISLELERLATEGKLEFKNGFYFLPGRSVILDTRQARYASSFKKYRRAEAFSKFFSFIPGVRLVAVCNTLAWRHSRPESDIDFFIITKPGHLWSARFVSTVLATLFRVRPAKNGAPDAVCLSFFASEDALDLRRLMIKDDIYFPYWVISLVPLYDAGGVFDKFKKANDWILSILPNASFRDVLILKHGSGRVWPEIPRIVENFLKKIQIRAFPEDINRKSSAFSTEVIVNDNYLKLHTDDRREFFRNAWTEQCNKII